MAGVRATPTRKWVEPGAAWETGGAEVIRCRRGRPPLAMEATPVASQCLCEKSYHAPVSGQTNISNHLKITHDTHARAHTKHNTRAHTAPTEMLESVAQPRARGTRPKIALPPRYDMESSLLESSL